MPKQIVRWLLSVHSITCLAPVLLGTLNATPATNVVINTNSSGAGSLRQAILNANANPDLDYIAFDIPGGASSYTITPGNGANALPSIDSPVILDGTTQPLFNERPMIQVDGISAGDVDGLLIYSGGTTVRGLVINRFARSAIRIEGAGTNFIQGNYIGTGVYGTNSLSNGRGATGNWGGIFIWNSPGNVIGGVETTNRNLISGNSSQSGIYLSGVGSTGNLIQGNLIGTDVTGTKRLGNMDGILLSMASGNQIGGTEVGARNIISGNNQVGIYIQGDGGGSGGSAGNSVQGNYIGVATNGNTVLSNASDGIAIADSDRNLIGGTNSNARNLISGNGGRGVSIYFNYDTNATANLVQGNYIGVGTAGTNKLGNVYSGIEISKVSGNTVGGTDPGTLNVISANGRSGVAFTGGSFNNVLAGNYIGTDFTGTNALGNTNNGVFIYAASNNIVGGTVAEARNVISGNLADGVSLTNSIGNLIQGNFIGTDTNGQRRLGNGIVGVACEQASGNTIGGTASGARNVISGNVNNGVLIAGARASNNVICGNLIGTDIFGTNALGNFAAGIGIDNAPANTIGGTAPGAFNVISGNANEGIYATGAGATRNLIQGNYIGTDITGNSALANAKSGVYLYAAPTNTVGGTNAGARNLISGNNGRGIYLGASASVIQGNFIGTKADGVSALGNLWHGVDVDNNCSNIIIGGGVSGAANIIAFAREDAYDGVRVRNNCTGIFISGNSIHSNGGSSLYGLGIDLAIDGVTTNDLCDIDTGANLLQNFPVLTSAASGSATTTVNGTLNSTASGVFLLQFYANANNEPSGYGEGQTYLGSALVTNGPNCNANLSFTVVLPVASPSGQFVTATATDANNNTSEVSAAVVLPQLPGIAVQPTNQTVIQGQSAAFNVSATGALPLSYQWRLNGTVISGATTNSYFVSIAQTNDAGGYVVVVTNYLGSVTSSLATLTVNVPPTVTAQPTNLAVTLGQSATFTVSAAGTAPLSYQWRFSGTNIAGATASTYTRINAQTNHAGNYLVVITNLAGSVNSSVAALTVRVPPTITLQPTNLTVRRCQNAIFAVSAAGDAPLRYQWQCSGTNIPGATASTYTRANVTTNDAAAYRVVITNVAGSLTSSNATLTVVPALATLVISYSNSLVRISWTACAEGLVLKESESLTPPLWTLVTNTPVLSGSDYVVIITPALDTNRFYRLTPP